MTTSHQQGSHETPTTPEEQEEIPLLQLFPLLEPPHSLRQRVLRTYGGLLVWPAIGLALGVIIAAAIAASTTSFGVLAVIFLVLVSCCLGGWGLGMWHTNRLGLGEFTVWCAGLLPFPVVVLGTVLESWEAALAAVLSAPLVVALVAHKRWATALAAAVGAAALVGTAGMGVFTVDAEEARSALVEDLRASDVVPFADLDFRTTYRPSDVDVDWDRVTYVVEADYLTHHVTIAPDDSGAAWTTKRTPDGDAVRHDEGMRITVETRTGVGARDTEAAVEYAEGLERTDPEGFAGLVEH